MEDKNNFDINKHLENQEKEYLKRNVDGKVILFWILLIGIFLAVDIALFVNAVFPELNILLLNSEESLKLGIFLAVFLLPFIIYLFTLIKVWLSAKLNKPIVFSKLYKYGIPILASIILNAFPIVIAGNINEIFKNVGMLIYYLIVEFFTISILIKYIFDLVKYFWKKIRKDKNNLK